jgi:CDP-diacylglycerol---serine O-phosphatidyltransferase
MLKQHLANILTMSNLFCGCCAIVCLFQNQHAGVVIFFALGFLFDALDGRVARHFGVTGPMGKELDSLADMVTFGVLPGTIMYYLLSKAMGFGEYARMFGLGHGGGVVLWAFPAFLISVFAGLRLAKYNLDTRQSDTFIGLPTPANTTFVIGLFLIYMNNTMPPGNWFVDAAGNPQGFGDLLMNPFLLFGIIGVLSFLQIAEIPMLNFRFKDYTFANNMARYLFLALSVLSILSLREGSPALIITLYVLVSIVNNMMTKSNA